MAKSSGKVGSLFYGMTLDTKDFKKKLKDSRKALKSIGEEMREAFSAVATGFTVVGAGVAAGSGAMFAFAKSTAEANNEQILLANSIGATQSEIAGLELATTRWGVESDMVIDKMREVGGINEFKKIADQVKNAGDEQAQLNKAVELFGGEGAKMLTVLQQGSAGLKAMEQEAIALGLALSPEQIAQNNAAWGQFEDTLLSLKGLSKQIGTSFLGFFGTTSAGVKGLIKAFGDDFKKALQSTADSLTESMTVAFKWFADNGIPFIKSFISFANQIGQTFVNVFNFITGGADNAFSFIGNLTDTMTMVFLNFGSTIKASFLTAAKFIIEGTFKLVAMFSDFIGSAFSEISKVAAFVGLIEESTANAIKEAFDDQGDAIRQFGVDLAKPTSDMLEKTTDKMANVFEENRKNSEKQGAAFKSITDKFSFTFKEAGKITKQAAKDNKKTAAAVANLSTERAVLAQTGTQEEFRIRQGAKQTEIASKQLNEQKKLRLAIERIGTA